MSRECCGPDAPIDGPSRPTVDLITGSQLGISSTPADDHHGIDDRHDDSDSAELASWWRDRSVLVALVAGVLLLVGYICIWTGFEIAGTLLHAVSLLAGASTFVPMAVRRLLQRRLGVGLLTSAPRTHSQNEWASSMSARLSYRPTKHAPSRACAPSAPPR